MTVRGNFQKAFLLANEKRSFLFSLLLGFFFLLFFSLFVFKTS